MFVTIWVLIGGGMLTLLIAAMGKQKRNTCKDYAITIKGARNNFFIDKADIVKIIESCRERQYQRQTKNIFQSAADWKTCWKKMNGSKMRNFILITKMYCMYRLQKENR